MSNPSPLRILHLLPGSTPGGVTRYVHDLGEAMAAQGHAITAAGESGAWRTLFEHSAIRWLDAPLTRGGPFALWRTVGRLEHHLREHPADLIHTHSRRAALVGRRLARRLGLPMLYTLHLTGMPQRGLLSWLSDFGDLTHVAAQEARRWLIEEAGVADQRIVVIPHGVDAELFPLATAQQQKAARATLGLPTGATLAGYVGRFDAPKNVAWLVDLAQRTRATLPTLHVVLVGAGPHEAMLRQTIDARGLSERVTLLPFGDPLPVYQAIDALLLPSSLEGFSLACAEAMAVGRPVLRTRTAGTFELIVEGVTGRATPIDHEAFLAAAENYLADRPALEPMGQAAAARVRSRFTHPRQVEQTTALYRRMMDKAVDRTSLIS